MLHPTRSRSAANDARRSGRLRRGRAGTRNVTSLVARIVTWITAAVIALWPCGAHAEEAAPPRLLAHYMPWFEADPAAGRWGWHWTMNRFDPAKSVGGHPEIASTFHPVIGPYDSADPHVVEYHLLLMRLAGIDGVIVDWYGRADLWDHARIHRCAQLVVDRAARLGLDVAVCYEDRTIADLVREGRIAATARVDQAAAEVGWLAANWFPRDHYLRLDGRPVLLSFGHEGLDDEEWSRVLALAGGPVALFSEHRRRPGAAGGFDWPVPREGLAAQERFARESQGWPARIPVVFPRFVDIYAEAGVHPSWGRIDDADGATFDRTLAAALAMRPGFVQIATWNDWGEGTMIEPSVEIGTRDLEALQHARRTLTPGFAPTKEHLTLPGQLLARRRAATDAALQSRLDAVAALIGRLEPAAAAEAMRAIGPAPGP
jgi:hypothetical protein